MRKYNVEKFKELLCYGYYPSGRGFNNAEININKDFLSQAEAINNWDKNVNLDINEIETILLDQLLNISKQNKKITLLLSSGIDSTYLGILMNKLNIKYNTLTLEFENYSETEGAIYIAQHILNKNNDEIKVIKISSQNLLDDINDILIKMPSPFEKGSVLLSYYLTKYADDIIIAGDGADTIFSPSFEKKISNLEKGIYHNEYIDPCDVDKINPIRKYKYADDNIKNMMLFSVIKDQRYYYDAKYRYFLRENQEIVLPYICKSLLKYTLRAKELHKKYRKFYLKELVNKYTNHNFYKIALKADRNVLLNIFQHKFDNDFLKKITNGYSIEDFVDIDKIKLLTSMYLYWIDVKSIEI